jgi:hypothetical protein
MRAFLLATALLLAAGILPAPAQNAAPTVTPAMDGIFAAFKTHSLVGLGEHHRIAQELDFYNALVRDPRFAREVGNVVVEFGGAAHQDIIDRYVAGEEVPYTELRKVWTDTVGWVPAVTGIGYPNFFAQLREVNRSLPPQERIRVWLGEPVIDWDKIKTHDEWFAINRTRDDFAADVIERNVLARGKKALVIYGGAHFELPVPGTAGEKLQKAGWRNANLGDLIRRRHPGALYVALFYNGTANKDCAQDVEHGMSSWPVPALISPARGSFVADKLRACSTLRAEDGEFPPGLTDQEKQQIVDATKDVMSQADAVLYVGLSGSLTYSPYIPDQYLDADYRRTIARRYTLQTGQPYPDYPIRDFAALRKVRP